MPLQYSASWQDAEALARRMASYEEQARRGSWQKIRRLAASLPFAEDLLAAHYCAFDRRAPLRVKAALLGALAYFVVPKGWIRNYVAVIGYADDAAVLAAAIKLLGWHITPHHREAARRALARLRGE